MSSWVHQRCIHVILVLAQLLYLTHTPDPRVLYIYFFSRTIFFVSHLRVCFCIIIYTIPTPLAIGFTFDVIYQYTVGLCEIWTFSECRVLLRIFSLLSHSIIPTSHFVISLIIFTFCYTPYSANILSVTFCFTLVYRGRPLYLQQYF